MGFEVQIADTMHKKLLKAMIFYSKQSKEAEK